MLLAPATSSGAGLAEPAHEQPLYSNERAENDKDYNLRTSGSVEPRFNDRAQKTFNLRVQETGRCAWLMPSSEQRDRQICHSTDSSLLRNIEVPEALIGAWVESDGRPFFLKCGQL